MNLRIFPCFSPFQKNCQKLLKNASIKGWQKMARDDQKWPGSAGNGRGWLKIAENCQRCPEMDRNGQGRWEMAIWMTKNERKLPFMAGIDQIWQEMAGNKRIYGVKLP